MTTADTVLMSRRQRQQSRERSRPLVTSIDALTLERQQLLLSLKTVGCVALTVLFLRLGVPGPAFVSLAVGVLLLSRSQAG